MKYCSECGGEVEQRVPEGDDRPRAVCPRCETIHYVNPKMVVGCVVEHCGKLLLCRRSIEPALGRWTFPAGFMENGESSEDGAVRETREEAAAEVDVLGPFAVLDLPHINQTYIVYRARLRGEEFGAGHESLEARLFAREEIPWEEMAFPVLRFALQLYFEDLDRGRPGCHSGAVCWTGNGSRYDFAEYELRQHRSG